MKEIMIKLKKKNTIIILEEDNEFKDIVTKEYIIKDGKIESK